MKIQMITKIATKVSAVTAKTMLKMKQHSPEISMAIGVVAVIGGTVWACKKTLEVEAIIDEGKKKQDALDAAFESPSLNKEGAVVVYSEESYKKDKAIVTVQTGAKLIKNYALPATVIGIGIGCFFMSHHILTKRNAALMAAYSALSDAFNTYRQRVIADKGTDQDLEYMYGTKSEKIKIKNEDGTKETKTIQTISEDQKKDPRMHSIYARFFDEGSRYYEKDNNNNKVFLYCQQNMMNDRLRTYGHVFLNEVYDALGFDHTEAGSIVGWVYKEGMQNFIDFGIYDLYNEGSREFVNGLEPIILLDFNVDGVIYDLIGKK